ncbi:MAG TPA: SAM-dependent methyltransferase [Pseudonocardiaceae bacterium]|jgi:hypothetical protein|nr:SAM-dependent methyltransferase [Pseudonocardiaceae bacterium]
MDELSPSVDTTRPNVARIYDWMLGGSANFAIDRELGQRMLDESGSTPLAPRLNRSFLRRAVRYLVEQDIDQFLDLGSGIPTVGNVHEIAQTANPDARVGYVDIEPVAIAHSQQILAGNPNAIAIGADLRDVDTVLAAAGRLLDFSRPVGLLMVAIIPFLPDADDPTGIIDRYLAALPSGSHLAISHVTADGTDDVARAVAFFDKTPTPVTIRSHAEVLSLLHGVELVEPGLVWTTLWRPDGGDPELPDPGRSGIYGAVGRR